MGGYSLWNQAGWFPTHQICMESNPQKKDQSWRYLYCSLQTILQSKDNQNSMGMEEKHIEQWSTIENQEIKPQVYGQILFDKGAKNIQWRKESLFYNCCWENWKVTCIKINSKWITDLNIRPETIKYTGGNIGTKLTELVCTEHCMNLTSNTEVEVKINEWNYIKLKSFCILKIKMQSTKSENMFANNSSNKGLISKIYKEL